MNRVKPINYCKGILLLTLLQTLSSCNLQDGTHYIIGNGSETLTVSVRAGNIGFYAENDITKGIEHDLLQLFSERTNRTIRINSVVSANQALTEVKNNRAEIAAGLLSLPEFEQEHFVNSYPYLKNYQEIVYRYDTPQLKSIKDIVIKNIDVTDNPAHLNTLTKIKLNNNDSTEWHLDETLSTHNLFKLTEQGFANYAVIDSVEIPLLRLYYPSVNQSLRISEEIPINWILSKDNRTCLDIEIENFFENIQESNELPNIIDRYYGHLDQIDYSGKLNFIENFEQHLPTYQPIFVEVAKYLNTDWKLLAAISYQESHWNPEALSPSGVVGMMMVTKEVAQKFNAEPRDEPIRNTVAGAKYLLELKRRLPKDITDPDRTWLALASYNRGFAFMQRVIKRAKSNQLDPTLWVNIRDTLNNTEGGDKVLEYVYNIRTYLDLLVWLTDQGESNVLPLNPEPTPAPPSAPL